MKTKPSLPILELAPDGGPIGILPKRLSTDETTVLRRCERTVIRGAAEFMRVGLALREIRERRLYRETHSSFEAHCLERFDFRRAHGNRLIEEATAITELQLQDPNGSTPLPENEGQARELADVVAEMRGEVMRRAAQKADGKPLSARLIREAGVELRASKAQHGCRSTIGWL